MEKQEIEMKREIPKITIEKSKVEDIEDIQEVFYITWLATYPNEEAGITVEDIEEKFKNRFYEENIQKRKDEVLDSSGNYLLLSAKEGSKIVGVCKLVKRESDNELQSLYILPDYQRMGIGKMFWNKALEFFDRKKDIIVPVATYNMKAINFYEKLGFVDTGKRIANKHKMPISGKCIPEMEMVMKAKSELY